MKRRYAGMIRKARRERLLENMIVAKEIRSQWNGLIQPFDIPLTTITTLKP